NIPPAGADDDAVLMCRAGVGDEMLGADVGCDHGRADDVPWHVLAAEEIFLGLGSLPARRYEADEERKNHVAGKDDQIERVELDVFHVSFALPVRACESHRQGARSPADWHPSAPAGADRRACPDMKSCA